MRQGRQVGVPFDTAVRGVRRSGKHLHASIGRVLTHWIGRIDELTPGRLPTHQPTWRKEFAVHGRFQSACPRCDAPVARISFAESETNYCPTCRTGGKVLADRRMSRLFRR